MSDISQIKTPDNNIHNIKALSLVESVKTTEETPYQLRPTPITANRCLEKLIGVSCAFNQLISSDANTDTSQGVTFTKNADGSYTLTGVPSGDNVFLNINYVPSQNKCGFIKDHIYYMPKGNSYNGRIGLACFGDSSDHYSIDGDILFKVNASSISASWLRIQVSSLSNTDIGTVKIYPQLFDLTACFGSEVADYLYNLENG